MSSIVPLQSVPNQTTQVVLNNQNCQLNVYQTNDALFMDVSVNDLLIIGGVICENQNRIVRSLYFEFSGDFIFNDLQPSPTDGPSDPFASGLGSRFILIYLSPSDLAGAG